MSGWHVRYLFHAAQKYAGTGDTVLERPVKMIEDMYELQRQLAEVIAQRHDVDVMDVQIGIVSCQPLSEAVCTCSETMVCAMCRERKGFSSGLSRVELP